MSELVSKKTWQEFRNTGLLLFINQILHVFGWAIVVVIDKETEEVTDAYPARVKFRGFPENAVEDSYKRVSQYMSENADQLRKEAEE